MNILTKTCRSALARMQCPVLLLLTCGILSPMARADEYHRHSDMLATAVNPTGNNSHAGMLCADTALWSYWLLPQDTPLEDEKQWLPLPGLKSLEFRERLAAPAPDNYFILHDYRIEPNKWSLYWNRKDGLHSPYPGAALLAVFTAPQDGRYLLSGQLSWQHWPGSELKDATLEVWQKNGRKENLLAATQLASVQSEQAFRAVHFDKAIDGRTLNLKKGEQVIIKVQGSRHPYRGIAIDDSKFAIRLQGAQPIDDASRETMILARQLETLLLDDVDELGPMREALSRRNFPLALDLFRDAFIKLNAQMQPPLTPNQWLYKPTTAEDVRNHSIQTIVYGHADEHLFYIGAPGEVTWNKIGIGKYPYLLRDLSSMHWANALAQSVAESGPASDADLWVRYWADLATRWPAQHAEMMRNKDVRALLTKDSLAWGRRAPLYFGWRLNNFFSWLPHVSQHLNPADYSVVNSVELARILIWYATDEIPLSIATLQEPTGVPNQRRLLANGLFESSASLQWFRSAPKSVAVVKEFVKEMARIEMLPDGGSMEQSLNYNKHMPEEVDSLLITNSNLPVALQFSDAEVAYLKRARSYRFAMLNALLEPNMHPPSIGKNNPYIFFNTWPDQLAEYPISQAMFEAFKGDSSHLDFTSVYFPWSGYTVLRTDWTEQAAYSIFQNSRAGLGHHRESAMHLSIFAYGEPLLVTSGAEQYSMEKNFDAYFQSSIAQNTIGVDGYGQLAQAGGERPDYSKPIHARWLSSEHIDYIEGVYDGPYGGWNHLTDGNATARVIARERTAVLSGITHQRKVIFLRKMHIWIVVDRINSKQQHQFTQSWNFSPQFTPEDIIIDQADSLIKATLPSGPSFTLLQASTAERTASYEIYYGVHTPTKILGWVSKDSAPKAYDFAPAPDIHRNWKSAGTQTIVTVIASAPDSKKRIVTHSTDQTQNELMLNIELSGGDRLFVRVDNATDTVSAKAMASGTELLVNTSPQAASATISEHGTPSVTLPIQYPLGFNWVQTNKKWHPEYSKSNSSEWGQ